MKKCVAAVLLLMPMSFHPVLAKPIEQNKTESCAKEASKKPEKERYDFMRGCVQHKDRQEKPSGSQEAQRAKVNACNADARSDGKVSTEQCQK